MRRVVLAGAAALALVVSVTVWAGGSGSACSLDQLTAATGQVDALAGVTPFGEGALVVGARYAGSLGGALVATATPDGTYDAHLIDVFGHVVVQLDDVAASGAEAWAVGSLADTAPVAVHWDGSAWSAMPIADPGTGEDGLSGVAAIDPGDVWAVGRHQVGANFVPLIERFDGSAWAMVTSPHTGSSDALKDVAAVGAGDVWAVGWSVVGQEFRPLALHLVGSAWKIVPTPPVADEGVFTGVVARGPRNVWAVGWTGRGDDLRPLVERWDGKRWAIVAPPNGTRTSLLAVAATPEGIVVAGRQTNDQDQPQPFVAFRAGQVWTDASAPVAGAAWLTSIAVDAGGRTWGVGSSFPSNAVVTGLVVSGCPQS